MKIIEKIEKIIACVCVTVMTILVFTNIIMRFVFNHSLALPDEMSTYLFVLMSFMGTAIATRKRAHLGLSIVTDRLSEKGRKYVSVAMYGISALFCLLIVIFGVRMVMSQYTLGQRTAGMQWPEWIYGLFVPAGAAFAMIAFLDEMLKMATGKEEALPQEKSVGDFWVESNGEDPAIEGKEDK